MNKYIVILTIVGILVFRISAFAQDLVWGDISRGNLDVKTVLVQPDNPAIIYLGSKNGVFKTEDNGENWRNILSLKGENRVVNFLLCDPKDKNSLYAATGNGLYHSPDQGKRWMRIFKGKSYLENECTVLAVLPYAIHLGTKAGLFVSKDKGRSWYRQAGELGKTAILSIASHPKEPDYIYVACVEGVFKTKNKGQSWEKVFVASPTETNGDVEQTLEDQDEAQRFSDVRYISIDPNNINHLYLATSKGVYESKDRGESLNLMTDFGLLSQDIKFLFVSQQSHIYAVTKSGIFEYRDERWYELSFGLVAEEINSLSMDSQGNLYAACDKGLFKAKLGDFANGKQDNTLALYYKDEPGIKEVQQAAIKYAEVEPEKIKRWRKQARMKAILPKLTVGLDRSESTNYEIYTSSTTRYVYEGPDDKSSGFDVTLSWELGDLIWSDDQTNIDVRSRLMVQLRDDILDEVTKLYFERIRVKMELDNLSIEERKKRLEKELKLQELTASLDGLTGGYFSRQ